MLLQLLQYEAKTGEFKQHSKLWTMKLFSRQQILFSIFYITVFKSGKVLLKCET